jgi:hypothetical protein
MPFLLREIAFCECGRPALPGSIECRTCYEDALRRRWREELRVEEGPRAVAPIAPMAIKMIKPRLRGLYAPTMSEEDGTRSVPAPL